MHPAARESGDELPVDLRDALTRRRLEDAAVAALHAVDVVQFEPDWWDGQAHAPCLVVRGGRHLMRVVESAGDAVVLPFDRRTAQRWLADLRRPRRPELGVPAQRSASDVVVDTANDVARCRSGGCGALLPVGYSAACPVCGGAGESDEKSTATGARTAASSISK